MTAIDIAIAPAIVGAIAMRFDSVDYHTARFKSSEVAKAAGIEINSFRSYFKRGQFRMLGETEELAAGQGASHRWSLRDAMGFAIAGELIRAGVDASAAFNAGMWGFAHISSGISVPAPKDQLPLRNPGELWDFGAFGSTIMAFFPATSNVRVFPVRHKLDINDALYDPQTRTRATSILLYLNDIEQRVFTVLGLNASGAAQ